MTRRLPLWISIIMILLAWAWTGWLGLQHVHGRGTLLDRAEIVIMDWRFALAGTKPAPPGIVIVAIDEATIESHGRFPLDRAVLARLVRQITALGVKALAIDLLLIDATDADVELADAMRNIPTVIAAAGLFDPQDISAMPVPSTTGELMPRADFANAADVGLANIATDAGGTPRHMPLVFASPQGLFPSFAILAAGHALGEDIPLVSGGARVGGALRPTDIGWHLPLRFFGPRGTFPTVSAQSVLEGEPVSIEGDLVLIGATAAGVGDRFSTPYDPVLPGVEVMATGIANLLLGTQLIRNDTVRWVDAAGALFVVSIGCLALFYLPLASSSLVCLGLITAWFAVCAVSFGMGFWLSGVLPAAAALPPFTCITLLRHIFDRRSAEFDAQARKELGRFHAPAMAKLITENPDFLRAPRRQEAAIVFLDLAGFTQVSERLGPAATGELLKEFHALSVEVSQRFGGLVLDYMGDGALIAFGVPEPGPDDAARALQASFELTGTLQKWIREAPLAKDLGGTRIGAQCGPIVLSRLGHHDHQQIAASGDPVNVASRLLEIAKEHNCAVAASTDLLCQAYATHSGFPQPEITKRVNLRGRRVPLEVAMWAHLE